MSRIQEYINYRLPRWEELPDMELYADQVLSVVKKNVEFFNSEIEMVFTSNMINNYVKQKIVKPPQNKKYDRVHLAYFTAVCIFKQFMNISDLCDAIAFLMKKYSVKELYDIFANELENALKSTFDSKNFKINTYENEAKEIKIIRAATLTFANLAYAKYMVRSN